MNLKEIKDNQTKKVLEFSIPAIIAMLLTALVTVADGAFMGNYVGKEGIAAVNLGLPIVYLYLGVGLMVSVGGVAMAGMSLGAGGKERSNEIFRQTIATTAAFSAVLSLGMGFCFQPMLSVLRAEGIVKEYFTTYYWIMLITLPVMVVNSSLGMFVRGDGKPEFYMKVTILNVLMNVILDYGLAGLLGLGAAGIAGASLASALISTICMLYYFKKTAEIYHLGAFHFSGKVLVEGILNGSSEFIGEMSTGIAMFAYNFVIMRRFGTDGVAAFTIVGYVSYVFSMVVVGFGQGASPLISFCYGAGEKEVAASIRQKASRYVLGSGVVVFLAMAGIRDWYGGVFVQNEQVRAMVGEGMIIFMISFFFCGMNSMGSFYFTATGRALESAVISFSRGLVILLGCIFVLPALFGIWGVWLAAPVTEAVTLGITGCFLHQERKGTPNAKRAFPSPSESE